MNNIDQLFNKCPDFVDFAKGYFEYLSDLLGRLDVDKIGDFVRELEKAREDGKTIFLAGNGGSAATASHMANDIGIDVLKKGKNEKPFRAMSLTDNISVLTAIANDEIYDNIFVNQLRIHYRPGDMLVVISASGNSPNVVAAARWVAERDGKVVGIVGFDGGKLLEVCDMVVHTRSMKGEYGHTEDMHMIIEHLISNWLICKLKAGDLT
ncbi:SIS domain-containing protein [candidate division KSB3 bacterium]|nr:SIS domain-containing protein [candidate division KSB3 bacterium]